MDILIADANRDFLSSFKDYFSICGFSADTVFDGTQVITRVAQKHYDLVVLNRHIPRVRCRELVRMLNGERIPTIVITDRMIHTVMLMEDELANSYLRLPFFPGDLTELIGEVMKKHKDGSKFLCGGIEVDEKKFTLGESQRVTNEELDVLKALADSREINNKRAGPYINALNNKFEKLSKNSPRIKYIMNEGYRLVKNE